MEHQKRLSVIWTILRPLVHLVARIRFNYTTEVKQLPGPYIVVSNHVTDWDPIFVGAAFRDQMYFLSSEHIMRLGWLSRLLSWLLAPITRQKGGSAAGAVKAMLRILKNGGNIAFFPEGNRSWNGVTQSFPASTGKLVLSSGASLITFRIRGGYFSSPRWSGNSCRRGRMTGEIVRIYSPEELRAMTPEEINRIIAEDISEDAYAALPSPFRGKNLAEHLETYLFKCPKCGAMHQLESSGDWFRCNACGTQARYSVTGRFADNGFPFHTVWEWGEWQEQQLRKLCANAGDQPIFSDAGLSLYRVVSAKSSELLAQGEMTLYRDQLVLPGEIVIPVSKITGMSLRGATDLYIGTANGSSLEIKTDHICCTKKYLDACLNLDCPIEYGI